MAQAYVEKFKSYKNNLEKKVNQSTQTSDLNEFYFNLSSSKHARLYYSESYNDLVLSLNINKSKSFIITKSMWKVFRNHINNIDNILNN
jgi:hypothetical protein